MNVLTELMQLPSLWLLIIGVIGVYFVIKLIRSIVAKVMSFSRRKAKVQKDSPSNNCLRMIR